MTKMRNGKRIVQGIDNSTIRFLRLTRTENLITK